ncbi:MAG: YbbR-like domain-containing protein [Bacillati bacterium ANGP1]|uniref:YbbR-like domain-containing protein n=1 Tax=Candidatus Segetimicrobium genomatis TaxID=2569760 RepID=A0A537L2S7_9BACT|nr:MAG: YbbR-like domain-containing protein [Terrabacteria group bacterium ANGP1]
MAVVADVPPGMRSRRLFSEQNLLLLLSFLIAVTSWYYVVTTQNPRFPRTTFKVVAVIPDITGEPAYGYSVLGVRVTPPTVTITGLPEQLVEIETVRTEPVMITGATQDVVRDVGLVVPPELARSTRVRVAVQIAPAIAATTVRGVRVQVQNAPAGLVTRVEPATVDVQVQGPVSIINKIRPDDLLARVDGTTFSTGRRRVTLTVQTPPEVTVLAIKPAAVLIVVIRKGS